MTQEHSKKSAKGLPLTRLVHGGKSPQFDGGTAANPPLARASTVRYKDLAQQRDLRKCRNDERLFTYGARGTPTGFTLKDMVNELEGGCHTRLDRNFAAL